MAKDTKVRGNKKAPSKKGGAYIIQELSMVDFPSGEDGDPRSIYMDTNLGTFCSTVEALKKLRESGREGKFRVIAIKTMCEAKKETKSSLKLS